MQSKWGGVYNGYTLTCDGDPVLRQYINTSKTMVMVNRHILRLECFSVSDRMQKQKQDILGRY